MWRQPAGSLFEVGDWSLYNLLAKQEILLAIEGSNNFRPPNGSADNLYNGCHMLLFKNAIPQSFCESLKKLSKASSEYKNHKIWLFDINWGSDICPLFITMPAKDFLFIATNKAFLQTTIDRMTLGIAARKRALPDSLPEWKYVDKSKRYWAIRHFHEPRTMDWLEQAFQPEFGYSKKSRPTGAIAQLDGPHIDSLTLTVLCKDPAVIRQTDKLAEFIGESDLHLLVNRISKQAWTFSPKAGDYFISFLQVIRAYMGHAIYL